MSRSHCTACDFARHGVKTRKALNHTCGLTYQQMKEREAWQAKRDKELNEQWQEYHRLKGLGLSDSDIELSIHDFIRQQKTR